LRTGTSRELLTGIEHEYSVLVDGSPVDFRTLLHGLDLDGRRIDAVDPDAYRCDWGGIITADGAEAEVATPPVRVVPGFIGLANRWAQLGRSRLTTALPAGTTLAGYSTHISVAVPERQEWTVSRRFVSRFAAPMMLLLDNRSSPGILVRPRRGRVELCGDFVTGPHLMAATALAVGGVLACGGSVRRLPPRLRPMVTPAVIRPGYYIPRTAFGGDLYAGGRDCLLRSRWGALRAQTTLEAGAEAALEALEGLADPGDVTHLHAAVSGSLSLPLEATAVDDPSPPGLPDVGPASPFGAALRARQRPAFRLRCVLASWDVAVFELRGLRTAYAAVPRHQLESFLDDVDRGRWDTRAEAFLARAATGHALSAKPPGDSIELFDQLGPSDRWAPEDPPRRGRFGGGGSSGDHPSKQDQAELEPSAPQPAVQVSAELGPSAPQPELQVSATTAPRLPWRWIVPAGAAVTAVALAVVLTGADPGRAETAIEFTQGPFTISMNMTLEQTTARAGDSIDFVFDVTSEGPSTAIGPDGVALIDCNPVLSASIPPGRLDVAYLPVADFPPGPQLDAATTQLYELILPEGGTADEGFIEYSPLTHEPSGDCFLRHSATGQGSFPVPDLPPGEYWIVVPQNVITRPAPGDLSGQHAPPVPTSISLSSIVVEG
jgi:hypothetical protein